MKMLIFLGYKFNLLYINKLFEFKIIIYNFIRKCEEFN